MVLQLKVMMNAIVTIEWGDGETESVKWKVDDWGEVKHSYQSPGYYRITIKNRRGERIDGIPYCFSQGNMLNRRFRL